MPSWTNKPKTQTELGIEYILTPDGERILVGASEDQPLIYQIASSLWSLKNKLESVWGNMSKNLTTHYLALQNSDSFALQNGDLFATHRTTTPDWTLKSKQI